MYYSLPPILCLLLILVLNSDVLFYSDGTEKMPGFKEYRFYLLGFVAFLITDILWGFFDQFGLVDAAYFDNAVYFVLMALTVLLWTRFVATYLDPKPRIRQALMILGWAFFAAGVTATIINFYHPILFTYNSGSFAPASVRIAFLSAQILMFIVTSVHSLVQIRHLEGVSKSRYIAIAVDGFVTASAILIQVFFPLLPLYCVGSTLGIAIIHTFVVAVEKRKFREALAEQETREAKQQEELGSVKMLAYNDPLTGSKNRHAYVAYEEEVDTLIRDGKMGEFALVIFDLNDLKIINDTRGHEAGDLYILASVAMIKKHYPGVTIYRFGGDEFAVFLTGEAFAIRHQSLTAFNAEVERNQGTGEPIIATGMAEFRKGEDNTLRAVFTRADQAMYNRKRKLKRATSGRAVLRSDVFELFYRSKEYSLIEMLNGSSCDEVAEVDLNHDTIHHFYHVEGKYLMPEADLSYHQLNRFVEECVVHPDDREQYRAMMNPDRFFERLARNKIPNFNFGHFRFRLQDGGYRYVEQCVIAGEDYDIAPGCFRMYISDIQNLKMRQEGQESNFALPLSKQHDSITGLWNNSFFFTHGEELVRANAKKRWCLLTLDIEHFKFFDEWYGRETGDVLLSRIGETLLRHQEEKGGLAGYFGHDDFAYLCPFSKKEIESIYEEVRALTVSFGLSVGFLPAIGVAVLEGAMRVDEAFDRANIAQARAKKDLRTRICYYDARIRDATAEEYRVLNEFMTAIKNDEFTFYVQPQCRISTGQIVGGEALARWIRIDGSIILPGEYIPVLEKYGFVMDLDQLLWEKVVKWLKEQLDQGIKPVPISVNVSRADIYTIDIAKHFHRLTEKYGLPRQYLKIEITESAYVDSSVQIGELVQKLRADGFAVLMDDFGSGYSSLNMLSSLEVDVIKLDGRFLNLDKDAYQRGIRILESVINMAKIIGLPIIVEGVETKEQMEFLRDLGCRYAQGFYFYHALPQEECVSLLQKKESVDYGGIVIKANEQFRLREFLDENVYSDSMLNGILGPVAIYALRTDDTVDIVRFNQQFYDAVHIPEFQSRLVNIAQYMPGKEQKALIDTLHRALENKLTGAVSVMNFLLPDGAVLSFRIHFYHIGSKEDGERFYGSAVDVTDLIDLSEEMHLISHYSDDNIIFIRKINGNWVYNVASHGLSDVIGLNPAELEAEMNDGRFAKRVIGKGKLAEFMEKTRDLTAKKEDFEQRFRIRCNDGKARTIDLRFSYAGDDVNNIQYIMKATLVTQE